MTYVAQTWCGARRMRKCVRTHKLPLLCCLFGFFWCSLAVLMICQYMRMALSETRQHGKVTGHRSRVGCPLDFCSNWFFFSFSFWLLLKSSLIVLPSLFSLVFLLYVCTPKLLSLCWTSILTMSVYFTSVFFFSFFFCLFFIADGLIWQICSYFCLCLFSKDRLLLPTSNSPYSSGLPLPYCTFRWKHFFRSKYNKVPGSLPTPVSDVSLTSKVHVHGFSWFNCLGVLIQQMSQWDTIWSTKNKHAAN